MPGVISVVGDPANPKVAEVVVRGTLTPEAPHLPRPCLSVWHFYRPTALFVADVTTVAAAFRAWYNTNVRVAQVSQFTVEQTEARFLDDPTSPTGVDVTALTGAITGDLYAPDTGIYVQLNSGMRGRNYFGSKHFGGAAEAQVTAGYLNSDPGVTAWLPVSAAIASLGTTGLTDADGNVWYLIVLAKSLCNLESNPATFVHTYVTGTALNTRVGTMGRRRGSRDIAV